ncbi:Universal stress protein A-like protein [Morus notabilis]|uniref:Universal stress protein A-like protein n=1 Tax=Morus notabilis TaxID=981085 RepID=W9R9E5_9ROSA|nr:Universal stress protein A-like protein [Morus notabilis]
MEREKERSRKKVMVVIDESDCSYKALIWVLENLKESLKQSPLFIFATQPLINSNFAVSPSLGFIRLTCTLSYILTNQAQERNKEVSMGLLDKAKSICANGGVNVKTFTEIGDPKEVICNAVQEHNIDLLVIGNNSYGILKRALLGSSLADYCLSNAKCPVLVVKKSE